MDGERSCLVISGASVIVCDATAEPRHRHSRGLEEAGAAGGTLFLELSGTMNGELDLGSVLFRSPLATLITTDSCLPQYNCQEKLETFFLRVVEKRFCIILRFNFAVFRCRKPNPHAVNT